MVKFTKFDLLHAGQLLVVVFLVAFAISWLYFSVVNKENDVTSELMQYESKSIEFSPVKIQSPLNSLVTTPDRADRGTSMANDEYFTDYCKL